MHPHRWVVVSMEERPPPAEAYRESGLQARGSVVRSLLLPSTIVKYRCEKCGSEKVVRV